MAKRNILYTVILLIILLGGTVYLTAQGGEEDPKESAGTEAVQTEGTRFDENAYPPNGWTENMAEAAAEAKESGKMILINFTGSDWCGWCMKLESEVFSQPGFLSWADENLVMVFLDSPSNIPQADNLVAQNQILQQALGIQGFPTIFLVDSDLTPLLRTGYQSGGAQNYIAHLETERLGLDEAAKENFRNGFSGLIEEQLVPLGL
ncbi:MAG: thioredoxin family protein [Spirochaetales bacterium]|nr:thioredoxin family protein [Spirochaetales bacterium]